MHRNVRHLLAGLTALATAVGGLLVPATSAQAAFTSTVGGEITRAEVMQRAQYWVDHQPGPYSNVDYSPDPTGSRNYRRDCSGYVDMAWHTATDNATYTMYQISYVINRRDLLPGDILNNHDHHVILFKRWSNSQHTEFDYYSFGSTPVKLKTGVSINAAKFDSHPNGQYVARRYNRIKEEGEQPAPKRNPDFSGDGVADVIGVTAAGHMQYYANGSLVNTNGVPFVGTGISSGDGWNMYSTFLAADFSGDAVSDVIGVTPGGHMQYYANGSLVNTNGVPFATAGISSGDGWNMYSRFLAADFSGDGVADVIGVTPGGHMQYYPNGSLVNTNGVPFVGGGISAGDGWNVYDKLIAADFSGDGVADVVGVTPGGHMQYYANGSLVNANGVPFATGGISSGDGWNAYDKLIAADFSGDRTPDLVGITAGGHMQYYANGSLVNTNGVPFVGSGLSNGEGWNAYSDLRAADFSGDGVADLVGITSGGNMQYYPNGSLVNPNHIPFGDGGRSSGSGWNTYTTRLV